MGNRRILGNAGMAERRVHAPEPARHFGRRAENSIHAVKIYASLVNHNDDPVAAQLGFSKPPD